MSVRSRAERSKSGPRAVEEQSMSLEWRARSSSLAWSNPVAWWWGLLTLVSGVNIAAWFVLYGRLHEQPTGSLGSTWLLLSRQLLEQPAGHLSSASGIELMLLLCAAY